MFVLLAFGGLVLINAFDEPLNPGARAALEARHDSTTAEENLYFAVLGMDFEGDARVDELGRKVYASYLEASRASPGKVHPLYQYDVFKKLQVAGEVSLLCGRSRQQEDCVDRVRIHPEELRLAVASNRGLVERYKSIQKFQHLQNPVPLTVNSPILQWQIFVSAKRLWLTEVALQAGSGHMAEAIDAFEEELAFTRRALAEQDILLIDKMVLANSMRMDLAFISDLARNAVLSDAQYSRLAGTVTPLTVRERSLAAVFAREFTAYASLLEPLVNPENASQLLYSNDDGRWSHRLAGDIGARFLKYNASLNSFWAQVERNQATARGSCVDLTANLDKARHAAPVPVLGYIYNPIGKVLSGVAGATGDEYIKSMCDLQGMVSIVALQLTIAAQHLNDAQIAAFVTQHAALYFDPYTGMPLAWQRSERSLSFRPGADRNVNYFPWPVGNHANGDRL